MVTLRALARNRLKRKERKLIRWVEQQHDGYCALNGRQLSVEQKQLCDQLQDFEWPSRDDLSLEAHFESLCQWGDRNDGIPGLEDVDDNCSPVGLSYRTPSRGWVELGHFVHWACIALRRNSCRLRKKTCIHGHVFFPKILSQSQRTSMKRWLEARERLVRPMQRDLQTMHGEHEPADIEDSDYATSIGSEVDRDTRSKATEPGAADVARGWYENWQDVTVQRDCENMSEFVQRRDWWIESVGVSIETVTHAAP